MMTGLLTRIFSRRGRATYDAPVDQSQAAADESATAAKLHTDKVAKKSLAEHVQFPAAYFKECSGLIASRGKMAHSTPCYDYMYEFSAFHLYFYCGESVQMLAERTGFRILSEHRIDKQFPDASYACFVFEKLD